MAKIDIQAGDIFAVDRLDGQFGFGRVLLDIKNQCVKRRELDPRSPLLNFRDAFLVEVFRDAASGPEGDPVDVAVNGIYMNDRLLRDGDWPVVGHREVVPAEVEFPENLVGVGTEGDFVRGEIRLSTSLSLDEIEQIAAFPTLRPEIAIVYICRHYADNEGVAPGLKTGDLRFSTERERVYESLDEDPDQSYDEMSKRHGHDLSRFYR